MASPFPGMDPYLEDQHYWPDFHHRFIDYCCDALADRLPDNYEARIDEWISLVEDPEVRPRDLKPDLAIAHQQGKTNPRASTSGATLEPVVVPLLMSDPHRQGYIKILHRPDRSVVAVLEVLSPTNKSGEGRGEYIGKRNALLNQPVHLVELDLFRQGRRLPMRAPLPQGEFFAMVARSEHRPDCQVYAWGIRDPLPVIPVPLRIPDADVTLNLAEVFAIVYERGRYGRSVNYGAPLSVSLGDPDRSWAAERVGARASAP